MKFPNFLMNRSFSARALVLLAGLFLMSIVVPAQKVPEAQASADLDQCRNGSTGTIACAGSAWVNGNAGFQNSQYSEDQYIPYRMRFSGLTIGAKYIVVIGYDTIHGGAHAIDYLGTYNTLQVVPRSTSTSVPRVPAVDPCSDVPGGCAAMSQITIPTDPNVTGSIDPLTNTNIYEPANQQMTLFGGTLLAIQYTAVNTGGGDTEQRMAIVFTANTVDPVLAWSGHVAYAGDWGIGQSAGGISGSPYHMRLIGFCSDPNATVFVCTDGGNQDRSLSADAVIVAGIVRVVKVANTVDGSGVANTPFAFTASANFGTGTFSLTDNVAGSAGASIVSPGIQSFGVGNEVTINEENTTGWTLSGLTCTGNALATANANILTQPAAHSGTAVITLSEGGQMTCTFTNSQLGITAAPASITGQIVSSGGSPLGGITVRLTDYTTGEIRTATSNSFGYYTFDNLTVQDFYQLTVSAKRYRFSNPSRTFTLSQDLSGIDFYCTSQ